MKALYETKARATGGRDGRSATLDGSFDVKMATPKELGGGGGPGNNPEQLFAAGYAACFLGAMKYSAGQQNVKLPDTVAVQSTVGIGPRDDGKGFGISVALEVAAPGMDRAAAQKVVDQAHIVCPYSHATRGNVDVKITLV
jgi:lipoyl-dependent peroxiredoxin